MIRIWILLTLVLPCLAWPAWPQSKPAPKEVLLFDFEDPADLKAWSNLELPGAKVKEPAAKLELSDDHATSGKKSLKVTFAGGHWPTITTTQVPTDWMPYWTFKADVTVSRHCVVGFTVMQERSQRGGGWDATVSRWTKTEFLKPGRNTVVGILHDPNNYSINAKNGKVVRFEIYMYNPQEGEAIFVDNIRILTAKETKPPVITKFAVLGTDLMVSGEISGVRELGKKLKDKWKKPEEKSLDEVEGAFRKQYEELKKKHPRAVLAILRDGEKGFDPAQPDKVYAGWKDAYFSSHGPDGMYRTRAENLARAQTQEIFMRHRSPLMRVDLSSIPTGSRILAARLIVVRATVDGRDARNNPTMWVVEPCNRPWEEYEVNAFQYAKDKFWKQVGGFHWSKDPDFLPVFLAYGPGRGKVNWWDFTLAVRFWTSGDHPNHGFMLHGDSRDYMMAHTRKAKEIKNRPAVLVVYEPK